MNLRLARPSLLVDVSRLDSLARVEDIGRAWRIGACVTHSRIEDMREQLAGGEMLCEVAAGIAYRAIRNRGTIGGSIAHADPASDWPLALAALGATVNIRNAGGARAMPLEKFLLGAFTTALREDEILEFVEVPKLSRAGRYGYYKFCRKTGEYAEASAAAVFAPGSQIARIYFGAVRPAPVSLSARPAGCRGGKQSAVSEEVISAAVVAAGNGRDLVERRMVKAPDAALEQVFRRDADLTNCERETVEALVEPRMHLGDLASIAGSLGCILAASRGLRRLHGPHRPCSGTLRHHLRGRLRLWPSARSRIRR